jgi:pimeloyl-ACP methyl ester carboxylesterase
VNRFALIAVASVAGLAAAAFSPSAVRAQAAPLNDLPRHGVIGLVVAPLDPSKPGDPKTNPPSIKTVVTGGAGDAAGMQPGDIVRELDGHAVTSGPEFAASIGRHLGGDTVTIKITRAGADIEKKAVLKPRPYETSPDAEILYSSVTAGGSRRRTIITHPKTSGRYPAVLFMGGLGCYSLDGALAQDTNYGPLLAALVKNNYVTMRVEKTGEGDSDDPGCTDEKATAQLEADGYVAALGALKNYSFVDPAKIFVFAHSLGPLIAALALPGQTLRGVVVAETIGRSWFEYGTENVRRQFALVGEPLDQVDDEVRQHAICAEHYFLAHENRDTVAALGQQCRDMIASNAGMSDAYMHQVGDINIARAWKQIDAPALVIYGASDPVTSADESRYLTMIINSFRPGHATYTEIAGMGHNFAQYKTPADFMNQPHDQKTVYTQEFLTVVLDWLAKQACD